MAAILIGYAHCSTDKQDLAAQKAALEQLGVTPERIYTDRVIRSVVMTPSKGGRRNRAAV